MMGPGRGEGPRAGDTPSLVGASMPAEFREVGKLLYGSRHEAIIASHLAALVGGWAPVPGKTFQVPLLGDTRCDFRVGMSLVEYHPIVLERELRSEFATKELRRISRQLQGWAVAAIREALEEELAVRYLADRRRLLRHSNNPDIHGCDLIHCCNADDVYVRVLQRYATEDLPPRGEFVARFDKQSRRRK